MTANNPKPVPEKNDSPEENPEGAEGAHAVTDKKKRFSVSFSKESIILLKIKIKERIILYITFVKKNFRPPLWTSIFSAIGIILFIGVGVWQTDLYHKRETLIEKIQRNSSKTPEPLPPASMLGDPEQYDYRPVTVSGEMMFLNSMNLMHRKFEGKDGYHILTPLRTDGGETVLIDRGWVADGQSPNNTYWKTTDITVKGYARIPEKKGRFTGDNNVRKNEWHWINLKAMAKHAGVMELHPLIIEQERTVSDKTVFPVGGQTVINVPNNFRTYSLLCFSVSGILLIVWIIYSFQNGIIINAAVEEAKTETGDSSEEDEDGLPVKKKKPSVDDDDAPPPAAKPKGK